MAKSFTFRTAVEEDLPHIQVLSGAAGGKIVPGDAGGGDFVVKAWPSWWTQHPNLHFNQWCFDGDFPAGFVRIECYGEPGRPESGWLEGLRINPSYQGQGVMSKVVTECLKQVPADMPMLLAVGSENAQMTPIADAKYAFLGGMVLHRWERDAAPDAAVAAAESTCALSARALQPADADEAWALLSSHAKQSAAPLLLPGRFYAFREPTRAALADKIAHGRARGAFAAAGGAGGARGAPRLVGLLFEFDSEIDRVDGAETVVLHFYTAVLAPRLERARGAAALRALARELPAVQPSTGRAQRNLLAAGPYLPPGGAAARVADFRVDDAAAQLLAAARFERLRPSHLRVYRMPRRREPAADDGAPRGVRMVRAALAASAVVGVLTLTLLALRRGRTSSS